MKEYNSKAENEQMIQRLQQFIMDYERSGHGAILSLPLPLHRAKQLLEALHPTPTVMPTDEEIDWFAMYFRKFDFWYVVPVEAVQGIKQLSTTIEGNIKYNVFKNNFGFVRYGF